MASIGALIVDLVAKTGGFETDLGRAARTAEKRSKEIDRSISRMGSRIVGSLSLIGAGFSFSEIIKATSEAEKALAQLDNAVRNNGGAAGFTTPQLADMSSELQKLTTYSDDAIQNMQALLLRFRGIGGAEFTRAQSAILDVATALGVDLQTAAKQVGKALEDPEKGLTALQKMGVRFSDSQKKVIKDLLDTGDRATAQGLILKQLEERFGGAAEAARNTFGGALEGLKNAFGDLLEAKSGLPGVTSEINKLTDALSSDEAKASADSLTSGLLKGFSAVAKAAGAIILPVAKLLTLANDLGAVLDNKLLGKSFSEDEFKRLFKVSARGTGPSRRGNTPMVTPIAGGEDEDTEAVDKSRKSIEQLIATQQQQIATYEKSAAATIAYRISQGDLADEFKALGSEADPLAAKLTSVTLQMEALQNATKQTEALNGIKDMVAALEQEVAVYGLSEAAALSYRISEGDLAKTFESAGSASQKYKDELVALTQQKIDLAAASETQAELEKQIEAAMARGAAITESVRTPQEQYAATVMELNDLLELGALKYDAYGKALEDAQDKLLEATDKWTVFKDQAARNTQDIIADTLVNGFDDGAKGILKSFSDMIVKLTAQAVAADLAGRLFGESAGGASGSGGGWISALAGLFGGGRATGGPVTAGTMYRVNEREPEYFKPNVGGKVVPLSKMSGGGAPITNHFTIQAPQGTVSRQTEMQIAAAASRSLAQASRRNN